MGKKKKKVASVSAPLTKDSDEMKEMHCEECEKHNDGYATAVSFCVDCVEYKCITCQKYHMRQLKTHKILENASMPQDFYFEKCPIHPMKLIKFYCCVCNKVTCQECKDYEHLTCCNVNHLPTLASNIQKSDEYKNLQQNLNNLSADIQVTEKLIKAKSEMIEEQEDKAIKTLREYGEKAKEAFKKQHQEIVDKFDKEMEETIARLNKERKELFEELSETEKTFEKNLQKADSEMKDHIVSTNTNFKLLKSEHTNLVTKLRDLINDLELAQKLDENCKLFIKMKSAKQLYTYLRLTIKALQKAEIHRYNLKTPDIQSLGDKIVFSFEKGHPLNVDRRVVFNFDINDSYGDTTQLLVLSEKFF